MRDVYRDVEYETKNKLEFTMPSATNQAKFDQVVSRQKAHYQSIYTKQALGESID